MNPGEMAVFAGLLYGHIKKETSDFQEQKAIMDIVATMLNCKNRGCILKELKDFTEAAKKQEPEAK